MTLPERTRVRLAEYMALPETNLRMELIDGEVIKLGSSDLVHQAVLSNCLMALIRLTPIVGGKVYLSPLDVILDHSHVVQPDVFWVAPEGSRCILDEQTNRLHGAPDLVVEVLSPGNAYHDRRVKFHLYQAHGVREYWMIDPRERLVEVWVLRDGKFMLLDVYGADETFTSTLMGEIAVSQFFES